MSRATHSRSDVSTADERQGLFCDVAPSVLADTSANGSGDPSTTAMEFQSSATLGAKDQHHVMFKIRKNRFPIVIVFCIVLLIAFIVLAILYSQELNKSSESSQPCDETQPKTYEICGEEKCFKLGLVATWCYVHQKLKRVKGQGIHDEAVFFKMLGKQTLVIFASSIITAVTGLKPCASVTSSVPGFALIGCVFKTLTKDDYQSCLKECRNDKRCISVNFLLTSNECELSDQSKDSRPERYQKRKYSIYCSNDVDRLPVLIKGMKELPGSSCQDIIYSGGFIGDGVYWIVKEGVLQKTTCTQTINSRSGY